ncbi:uncharacterized protein LAJ45_03331 [Morchella importuna]|uniref:uncharacterized protein n=1 Tax=Morchella importuna TaxID=1174673 RepID=UPI001E8D75E6|nr:uncharacterized protein LAJ45_03331 [Morchella importuna]KAH8152491.1 hypothetical protein LAJ45_03331 [Morchella importuna]
MKATLAHRHSTSTASNHQTVAAAVRRTKLSAPQLYQAESRLLLSHHIPPPTHSLTRSPPPHASSSSSSGRDVTRSIIKEKKPARERQKVATAKNVQFLDLHTSSYCFCFTSYIINPYYSAATTTTTYYLHHTPPTQPRVE